MVMGDYSDINTIDRLERLVQPYSPNRLERLKQELLDRTDMRTVHVWNGHHLADRDIYEACMQAGVHPVMAEMKFGGLNEAAIYVCKCQMERQDLSDEYRKYLIGQRFAYEQAARSESKGSDSKYGIASEIAAEMFMSTGTVLKYNVYADAMDAVFDQDAGFARKLLSGMLRISHENVIELSRLKPEEIRAVAKSSEEEKVEHITLSYIRNEVKWSHIQPKKPVSRREQSEEKFSRKITIRQMPEYDPDAEVNSLCMTIDSWVSSIKRVNNSESFPLISHIASLRLMKKLSTLENTITAVQESLVERTGN